MEQNQRSEKKVFVRQIIKIVKNPLAQKKSDIFPSTEIIFLYFGKNMT